MSPLLGAVLLPSGMITLLIIAASALYFIFKRRTMAGYTTALTALVYLFFSNSLITLWLMGNLEREFLPAQEAMTTDSVDTVVVLTGYALADDHRPLTGQVNSASGLRLLEAARIFTRTNRMTVVITGYGEVPTVMKDLLAQVGVPRANIVTEQESKNTYESAVQLRGRLAGKAFYLVTSAGHMPRALRVFRKQGLSAIPAPTDYRSPVSLVGTNILPSGRNLAISDLASHEYLGLMWYRLLNRI